VCVVAATAFEFDFFNFFFCAVCRFFFSIYIYLCVCVLFVYVLVVRHCATRPPQIVRPDVYHYTYTSYGRVYVYTFLPVEKFLEIRLLALRHTIGRLFLSRIRRSPCNTLSWSAHWAEGKDTVDRRKSRKYRLNIRVENPTTLGTKPRRRRSRDSADRFCRWSFLLAPLAKSRALQYII